MSESFERHDSAEPRACAVCAWPLEFSGVQGWHHTPVRLKALGEHVVVPVAYGEMRVNQCCDVCSAPATYHLPVEDFNMNPPESGVPPQISVGAWALCPGCVLLLGEHGVIRGLFRRAKQHAFQDVKLRPTVDNLAWLFHCYKGLEEHCHIEQLYLLDPSTIHPTQNPSVKTSST